jgi:hypothetical protein
VIGVPVTLIGETQSILGLIKPCLEKAAAGRLRKVESKQQVVRVFFSSQYSCRDLSFVYSNLATAVAGDDQDQQMSTWI